MGLLLAGPDIYYFRPFLFLMISAVNLHMTKRELERETEVPIEWKWARCSSRLYASKCRKNKWTKEFDTKIVLLNFGELHLTSAKEGCIPVNVGGRKACIKLSSQQQFISYKQTVAHSMNNLKQNVLLFSTMH
jgi:hypothetical protein